MDMLALFLQTSVQMGTPLLFATLGGILCEKAGHLNLGIEGMMLMGAVMGFKIAYITGNPLLAMLAAGLSASFGALLYAFITVTLRGNQIVTGLTLTIFGAGFSNFLGRNLSELSLPSSISGFFKLLDIPLLTNIPIIGKALFNQGIYVFISLFLAVFIYIYFNKTRFGLSLRAIGENPAAADASGIPITLYKYIHITAGGFLCGVGASYISLVFVPRWQDNLTAGQGWIAVVLIIFSTWNPLKAVFGAYLFGALRGLSFKLQGITLTLLGMKISFSPNILDMIPYAATIIVLIFITLRKKQEYQPPAWLGIPYFREDR